MLKKAVTLLILTAVCIHANAQGWKFDPRVGGIQEKMANSTIKLDIVKPIGKWTGTGIFFHFYNGKNPSRQIQVVITARHLIENALSVAMVWPTKTNDKSMAPAREKIAYTKDNIRIESHPDKTIDLCAIIVSHAVCELRNKGKEPAFFSFDTSVLADDDFYAKERQLDPVVMIGYPVGLMDEVNLQPFFRRGVYATNPSLDYMGRKEFLLDIPNNGEASGSPVFHFDEKMYNDRTGGGANITIGSRLVMVGLSFDGVDPTSNAKSAVAITGPANNTAWIIKATRIRELGEAMVAKYLR